MIHARHYFYFEADGHCFKGARSPEPKMAPSKKVRIVPLQQMPMHQTRFLDALVNTGVFCFSLIEWRRAKSGRKRSTELAPMVLFDRLGDYFFKK